MLNLNKLFAVAFVAVFISAMIPLALCTQSDIVQVTQEITILGEKNPEASNRPKPAPTSADYKISINRGKTAIPVTLTVYTDNNEGISEAAFSSAITAAATEWDSNTLAGLVGDISQSTGTASIIYNGVNAVFFADLDQGVIAMASYWYNRATKEIVECDISFNTDFTWGDATINPSVMDLQNIATHELGHFFNLADIYDTSKDYLTMYGRSYEGDIEKRSLSDGDKLGIKAVFGP